jgi:DNA repair protein RadA/Sms
MEEQLVETPEAKPRGWGFAVEQPPRPITEIEGEEGERLKTRIEEFDRVLGGGIVSGSIVLIGGDPGIGKSTLLLQVSDRLSREDLKVLYVSGEESPKQTKIRGERLGIANQNPGREAGNSRLQPVGAFRDFSRGNLQRNPETQTLCPHH